MRIGNLISLILVSDPVIDPVVGARERGTKGIGCYQLLIS